MKTTTKIPVPARFSAFHNGQRVEIIDGPEKGRIGYFLHDPVSDAGGYVVWDLNVIRYTADAANDLRAAASAVVLAPDCVRCGSPTRAEAFNGGSLWYCSHCDLWH